MTSVLLQTLAIILTIISLFYMLNRDIRKDLSLQQKEMRKDLSEQQKEMRKDFDSMIQKLPIDYVRRDEFHDLKDHIDVRFKDVSQKITVVAEQKKTIVCRGPKSK